MKFTFPASWYDAVDKYDDGITVSAGCPMITLPAPTPEQAAYLAMVLAASNYDPRTIIGGPRGAKPGHCTEGKDCNCGGDTSEVRATCPNWTTI